MKKTVYWLPNGKRSFQKEKKVSKEITVKPQEFISPVETEVESSVADAVALEETLLKEGEEGSSDATETSDTDPSLKKRRGKKKVADLSE